MRTAIGISALSIGLSLAATAASAPKAGAGLPPAASADSCGPSFLDIYDFQVGDVFQYSMMSTYTAGGGYGAEEHDAKYLILSKQALGTGYRYEVASLTRSWTSFPPGPKTFGSGNAAWTLSDDPDRLALDRCRDSLAPMPVPSILPGGQFTGFYTRVKIPKGDTVDFPLATASMRIKILGESSGRFPGNGFPAANLYRDSAGRIPDTGSFRSKYLSVYAAGLGAVRGSVSSWEGGGSGFSLTGYIRNGITYGTVYPDSAFGVTLGVKPRSARTQASPPVFHLGPSGSFLFSAEGRGMLDQLGRQAPLSSDLKTR
jgi:hypothetical protein